MTDSTRSGIQQLAHDRLGGRLFITLEEAAALYGVSPRTARRWAAEYIASNGAYGIPVIQMTRRLRLVPLPRLFDQLGLEDRSFGDLSRYPADRPAAPDLKNSRR